MLKILIWGIFGVLVYLWARKKLGLDSGEERTTIHHHHYKEGKKKNPTKKSDEDYIDYEELK